MDVMLRRNPRPHYSKDAREEAGI